MMADPFRKMDSTSTYSPKSSPHGGRSPVVSRQDSSGTLKTTISLGKTPTIIHTGPFYLMKEPPEKAELTGDKDIMTEYGLHHALTKFKDKKVKEPLNTFLPNLPTINDNVNNMENSTLRSIIEKPPIGGKEIVALTSLQLAGFRLHPGPLPERYRHLNVTGVTRKNKNKQKKNKHKDGAVVSDPVSTDSIGAEPYEKKHKKQKRHEDDKERKKRKKEKKRKKKSHSPEPTISSGIGNNNSSAISLCSNNFGLTGSIASSGCGSSLSSLTASLSGSVLTPHQLPQMPLNTPTLPQQSALTAGSLLGSNSNSCTAINTSIPSGFGGLLNTGSGGSGGIGSNSNMGGSSFMNSAFSSSGGLSSSNLANSIGPGSGSGGNSNSGVGVAQNSSALLMSQQTLY